MLSIEETIPSFAAAPRIRTTRGFLRLELELFDAEIIEELCRHAEGRPRQDFARAALRLGILALRQAQGSLDAELVRRQTEELLGRLEMALDGALVEQRERLLREFSLDDRSSVLGRLVREVGSSNGQLHDGLREDLETVRREFSLDNDHGALSRLRRDMLELIADMTSRNDRFHDEVRRALEKIDVRRQEVDRSTRHGLEFESSLGEVLAADCRARDEILEASAYTTGRIPRCKKGDFVIILGADAAAAGGRIVVEAKEQRGYTLQAALAEIEVARRNREARVGLFVFSKRTAPDSVGALLRHGHDVVTVWDRDEPASDVALHAALSLARALSTRPGGEAGSAVDLGEIDDALVRLGQRAEELDQVATWAKTIEHNGLKIRTKAEAMRRDLEEQLARLMRQLDGLRQEEERGELGKGSG